MHRIIENYGKKQAEDVNPEVVEAVEFLFGEGLKYREKTGKKRWFSTDFYNWCKKNMYEDDFKEIYKDLRNFYKQRVESGEIIPSYPDKP